MTMARVSTNSGCPGWFPKVPARPPLRLWKAAMAAGSGIEEISPGQVIPAEVADRGVPDCPVHRWDITSRRAGGRRG